MTQCTNKDALHTCFMLPCATDTYPRLTSQLSAVLEISQHTLPSPHIHVGARLHRQGVPMQGRATLVENERTTAQISESKCSPNHGDQILSLVEAVAMPVLYGSRYVQDGMATL